MHKIFVSVCVVVAILIAGTVFASCAGKGNPLVPQDFNSTNNENPTGTGLDQGAGTVDEPLLNLDSYHPDMGPDFAPDEVLVTFQDGFISYDVDGHIALDSAQNAVDFIDEHGLELIKEIPARWGTVYRLGITDGTSVQDKVSELKSDPVIDIAEPNYRMHLQESPYTPNDPMWENPTDDDNDPRTNVFEQFGPSKIGASYVWDDVTGEGVVVCVLDTGVIWDHEDLFDNMWVNEGEIPGDGLDNDGNDYIDDIYGWDVGQNDNDIKEYTNEHHYHGSACSGVVAAVRDNNVGCSGIAPGAKIMGIRLEFSGTFNSQIIEAVEYCLDNGADIVSMSFISSGYSESMENSFIAAEAAGLIPVAGAGNYEGTYVLYPCSFDSVVKVGATSPFSQAWAYNPIDEVRISIAAGFGWGSTYGNGVEVMAFGEHYITTYGGCTTCYWDGVDDNFFGGTSNATPMVAAAFALLKSYYPGESVQWYRNRMKFTADDLHGVGYDSETGYGRINMVRAIYGADRYVAEEDGSGFVDLSPHDYQVFDSLNYAQSGDYVDTLDMYKVAADEFGFLSVKLDIFTYGENLDIAITDFPSFEPQYILDEAVRVNHGNDNGEFIGAACNPGETYYIWVYPANPGDSSAYGMSTDIVHNSFDLTSWGSFDPGFIHVSGNNKLAGYLTFESGFRVHLDELHVSMTGSMPTSKLVGMHLYRDKDGDQGWDSGEEHIADAVGNGTNRWSFYGLDQEINMNGAVTYFLTVDIAGVSENAQFELVLTSYKDVSTTEGLEIPYNYFPVFMGPLTVGIDSDPPTWDDTVGAQFVEPGYASATLYWNAASDLLTPPIKYNVYWTQELPFDFAAANHQNNVSSSGGGDYDRKWKVPGLINGEEYYIAVRAEDQAGNEEDNIVYLSVTPEGTSYPDNPQVIGSRNTPGSAWEVVCDPANERVFVADYNGGVQIISVGNPTNPVIVDSVAASEVAGIDFDGTYVYAAGASGLLVIDPDAVGGAEIIGMLSFSHALDVQLAGTWAYLTNEGTDIKPVDISDPTTPVGYPNVDSGYYGFGMDEQNGYLYVATYTKPQVYDLSDPSAPVHVKQFGGDGAYEIDAMGDLLYVVYWEPNKFSIYDLTNPANPVWINQYYGTAGDDAADVIMFNGYLYFGLNNHHIEVLDVSDPMNIIKMGQVSTNGPDGLNTDGNFVYSAENEHGLKVII